MGQEEAFRRSVETTACGLPFHVANLQPLIADFATCRVVIVAAEAFG